MKNPERKKNLDRIKELHTVLRRSACGECPEGFRHVKLGNIANELLARIEVEYLCTQMDEPQDAVFMTLMEEGREMVRDICKKESRPDKHELN